MNVVCRGVRGATTIEKDSREEIVTATEELLHLMLESNQIQCEDIASVIFTTTPDVTSEYPAVAARKLPGWGDIALLCGHEMAVPHGLKKCIRVLLHWNTSKTVKDINHVFIKGAVSLRPDIAKLQKLHNNLHQEGR
ncbi:MAG TPA: chorismate mutase [Syntrophaceae bacterium]|jgi:chorismate mutase|nr:chorismate mutase [Syntrophaceae bacterium]